MFGAFPAQNRNWKPQIEVSAENVGYVPAEEFRVDPFLPAVGVDPFDPAGAVVIPSGRFVGHGFTSGRGSTYYRMTLADTGKTCITLADGKQITPTGMSTNMMYKETTMFMTDSNTAKYKKMFMAEVPFVLSINNAHGTLSTGDWVAPYFGSTTSTSVISFIHRGKPVKWSPLRLYTTAQVTASAAVSLTAAIYPGITPVVLASYAAGVFLPNVQSTVAWTGTYWTASFTSTGSSTVTSVHYSYGQDADQAAGEVTRLKSVTDILNTDSFLKWVEFADRDYLNFPTMRLAATKFPVTPVSNETPTTVTAGSRYRILATPNPMSVYHTVLVEVSNATVIDIAGNSTNYATNTWFALPTNTSLDNRGYFVGLYHTVNWRTGVIDIASNVTAISGTLSVRISYSYVTDARDGAALWGGGITNLTDGRNTPVAGASTSPLQTDWTGATNYPTPSTPAYGVPAHLNLTDVVGALRIFVK